MTLQKPTPRPKIRHPLKARVRGVNPILREQVFARDEWTCQSCLVPGGHLDPHHILPKGRGGRDELSNLVALHRSCHDQVHLNPRESKRRGLLA